MFSDVLNTDFNTILLNKCKPPLVGLRIVIIFSGNILHFFLNPLLSYKMLDLGFYPWSCYE